MKPLDLRANVGKDQKLLLGNNATGKCLQANMQHLFSPIPAIRWVSIFSYKNQKLVMKPLNLRANGAKHQKLLLGNNAPGKCLLAHIQFSSALAQLMRKNSLSQHFFIQKNKNLSWNRWIYSQWGQNTKNYSWATIPLASAYRPTCNISSALAALSRKDSLSQHFFIQKSKTCHETVEFTSQWGQNTKNYSWATIPLASAFRPTCNISSALAALSRKNSLSQHFFPTKIKNLSWNHWIYEPMGAKHPKTTPGQQCPWQVPSRPHTTFLQP